MRKNSKIAFIIFILAWLGGLLVWYLRNANFAILNPGGIVARQERHLMLITLLLAAVVVIPVYILTFVIAWRYRESQPRGSYQPELSGNLGAELVWWGIPAAIILTLSIITWHTSHSLDPAKRLSSTKQPLNIQVVALDWKWLFIYPDQHVASVNLLELPVNTPVNFSITADAPMNSFWIPQLGSQIYAMPGMSTQLNLMADKTGDYAGSSANLSGKGFSSMEFTARAVSEQDFQTWVHSATLQPASLDVASYKKLAAPSENVAPETFTLVDSQLYERIVLKYMEPEKF